MIAITTLRGRIVSIFLSIVIVLIVAEAVLIARLRDDLRAESARVAQDVGQKMVEIVAARQTPAAARASMPATMPLARIRPLNEPPAIHSEVVKTRANPSAGPDYAVKLDIPKNTMSSIPAQLMTPALETPQIPVPTQSLDRVGDHFANRMLVGSVIIIGFGLAAATIFLSRLTRPLDRLADGAARLGRGEIGVQIPADGTDEVKKTIDEFNRMSARLAELEERDRVARETRHLGEIADIGRGIAHSLRNPLHAIGLSLGELESGRTLDPAAADLIRGAKSHVARIDRTITTFLNLSGGARTKTESVDFRDVIDDVTLELLQSGDHGVSIDIDAGRDHPKIRGIAGEIRTLVHTLTTNAVEASPRGAKVKIHVETRADGAVVVRVEDHGRGLSDAVKKDLFRPHVTTKDRGLGLGLFLAKRIVTTCYNGSLALEPRADGGVCAELVFFDRRTDDVRKS